MTAKRSDKFADDCSLAVLLQPTQLSAKQIQLLEAARKNDVETLEKLLENKANVNVRNNLDRTALHWAVANGNAEAIDTLLKASANVNSADKYGMTPLLLAAWYGQTTAMDKLVKNKRIVLGCHNKQGMNAIHCAAVNAHLNIIELFQMNQLLEKLEINRQDLRGKSAIHLATEKGYTEMVNYLLTIDCDPSLSDLVGRTALHVAAAAGYDDIVSSLISSAANIVNSADNEGYTALHLAAISGHSIVVHQLMTVRADVNAVTQKGMTPLMLSASSCHLETVSLLLLDPGCDRNRQNNVGNAAVHLCASQKNSVNVLRALVSGRCDPNVTNEMGQTALHIAAEQGHTPSVQVLLDYGSDLSVRDNSGKTALGLAARANCIAIVDVIIKAERLQTTLRKTKEGSESSANTTEEGNALPPSAGGLMTSRLAETTGAGQREDELNRMTAADSGSAQDGKHIEGGKSPDRETSAAGHGPLNFPPDAVHSASIEDDISIPDSDSFLATSSVVGDAEQEPGVRERIAQAEQDAITHQDDLSDDVFDASEQHLKTPAAAAESDKISKYVAGLLDAGLLERQTSYDFHSISGGGHVMMRSSSQVHQSAMKSVLWKLGTKQLAPGEWKKLAKFWEFTPDQIQAIENQYTGQKSYRDHSYRMLVIWLECYLELHPPPTGNPLRGLFDGLTAINRRKLAEQIRQNCNKNSDARKSCVLS